MQSYKSYFLGKSSVLVMAWQKLGANSSNLLPNDSKPHNSRYDLEATDSARAQTIDCNTCRDYCKGAALSLAASDVRLKQSKSVNKGKDQLS